MNDAQADRSVSSYSQVSSRVSLILYNNIP